MPPSAVGLKLHVEFNINYPILSPGLLQCTTEARGTVLVLLLYSDVMKLS